MLGIALGLSVTVRRLVKEGRQEKEASFAQFAVGLCDQGSQVVHALIEEVATPSDQAADTYGIGGNYIAYQAAVAVFELPSNIRLANNPYTMHMLLEYIA